jgi:hypothetical protein
MTINAANYNTFERNITNPSISYASQLMRNENSSSCGNPYTGSKNPTKLAFRYLHAENLRPIRDFIKGNQRNMEDVQSYLKKIHMYKVPHSQGSRDVIYHIHSAASIPIATRKKITKEVYGSVPAGAESQFTALVSRAPCKFHRPSRQQRNYRCPVQRRTYRLPANDASDTMRLPGELQRLIKHAVEWGAYQANPDVRQQDVKLYSDMAVSKSSRTSLAEHAYEYLVGLAKELNVGDIPEYNDNVSNINEIWSKIQSHMWSGHRCLLSEFRKNWRRGYSAAKAHAQQGIQPRPRANGGGNGGNRDNRGDGGNVRRPNQPRRTRAASSVSVR